MIGCDASKLNYVYLHLNFINSILQLKVHSCLFISWLLLFYEGSKWALFVLPCISRIIFMSSCNFQVLYTIFLLSFHFLVLVHHLIMLLLNNFFLQFSSLSWLFKLLINFILLILLNLLFELALICAFAVGFFNFAVGRLFEISSFHILNNSRPSGLYFLFDTLGLHCYFID
jgi:hypothetical protein